jgi:hypothetical protein
MTSSEVPSRIPIKRPFAESGVLTPIADIDGNTLNYPTGFPSIYSVPASNGGKYLARGDINAIGNVATNDLFYHKCGGLNTFDANFAVKIGGYPKGAILDFVNGRYIHSVISLVDNNKVDFTGAIPTSSQASGGILTGSVDNVNWAYCNREESTETSITIFERTVTSSFQNVLVAEAPALPIGCFLATKSGPIIVTSDAKLNLEASISGTTMYDDTVLSHGIVGFGVIVYDLGTSASNYSSIVYPTADSLGNWKMVYANSLAEGMSISGGLSCAILGVISQSEMVKAVYGHYYAFAYYAGSLNDSRVDSQTPVTDGVPNYISGSASLEVSKVTARIG